MANKKPPPWLASSKIAAVDAAGQPVKNKGPELEKPKKSNPKLAAIQRRMEIRRRQAKAK